uniref:RING-type domain-containing protein n=1 Tax=Spongospora subterranea TaxID=70186 RepID=A0A0H5QHI7_9EUKA|eukprot:CRZ01443.1 hypothetical protein [Spongospora subterranea]
MSILLPEDPQSGSPWFIGLLKIFNRQYPIRCNTSKDALEFQCDQSLINLVHNACSTSSDLVSDLIQQRMSQYSNHDNLAEFLVEIQDIMERIVGCGPNISDNRAISVDKYPSKKYYECIIKEIGSIGWDHVEELDPSLARLRLRILDERGRNHVFSVRLEPDYPVSAPECLVDIPDEFQLSWSTKSTLHHIVQQCISAISQFDNFWCVLEDIDKFCHVIEPENPTRSSKSRRVAMEDHCSVLININPSAPFRFPECRFIGPESAVMPLMERLMLKSSDWDERLLPRENLEAILNLKLPAKKVQGEDTEFLLECGICYAPEHDGVVADRICDNVRCGRPFHNSCLIEWLKAIPNSRQSFQTVFGSCPYCSTQITAAL